MKHKSKKWMLQTKRADFRKISEKFGISPVLARCIVNREVQEEEIGNYIQADWRQLHSPWLFKDMEKAVQILRENREKLVAISSDFDCDGIFSAICSNAKRKSPKRMISRMTMLNKPFGIA